MLEPIITDDEMLEALAADGHMVAHSREAIEWKRANPADDLLTGADRTPRTTASRSQRRSSSTR